MAAELKSEFQVESELDAGGGGVFDVFVDEQLVFSRLSEGERFPDPGEVEARVHALKKS